MLDLHVLVIALALRTVTQPCHCGRYNYRCQTYTGKHPVKPQKLIKSNCYRITIVGPRELAVPLDENHPEYREKPCYTLKHTNVLLEGISQAQVLTKTIIAEDKLPQRIEDLAEISAPKAIHENVKKAILSANVFDCEQNKLPKIKDSERPAYNFPRILGITDRRRK